MSADSLAARRRVVVVGGGVSGLAAAHALAGDFDVVLLEQTSRTGGVIRTVEVAGGQVDVSADVFITRTPAAEELARSLGLGGRLAEPATSQAAVFARGMVRALPKGLVLGVPTDLGSLWRSGIVAPRSVWSVAEDLFRLRSARAHTAISQNDDPTIAEVIEPRLGTEVFANLVDPLLGGINAGDGRRLSFAATAPTLNEAVADKPSLVRALRPLARSGGPNGSSAPMFLGIVGGMEALTERLARECARLGVEIRTSVCAKQLERSAGARIAVETTAGEIGTDGVVIAVPAWASAKLVRSMSSQLAEELDAIPYSSVATVALAYPRDHSQKSLTGSGVLIPRGDPVSTAFTFASTKWPLSSEDSFVVRASVGRYGDDRALALDDSELVLRVRNEMSTILGIDTPPTATHVERFIDAFPQYVSGHLARRERIARFVNEIGRLQLTGSWMTGIGIPACISSARRVALTLADRLR